MLVLTRKPGQTILVGQDIVIEVLGRPGGRPVKLGIVAPEHQKILRGELDELPGPTPEPLPEAA